MNKLEKVILGMECCISNDDRCDECPYSTGKEQIGEMNGEPEYVYGCNRPTLIADALKLLKETEPRVTCSVCKYSRCLSGEWFCFMLGTSRYGRRVTDGDWYCKDAIGR